MTDQPVSPEKSDVSYDRPSRNPDLRSEAWADLGGGATAWAAGDITLSDLSGKPGPKRPLTGRATISGTNRREFDEQYGPSPVPSPKTMRGTPQVQRNKAAAMSGWLADELRQGNTQALIEAESNPASIPPLQAQDQSIVPQQPQLPLE